MSFYPRRRGGYINQQNQWSQWSPSIFGMHPLDAIYNFVSPMLDIVSPLEDLNSLMNQGLRRWNQVLPQMQKKQLVQKEQPWIAGGQKMPQKYRIVIDCVGLGFDPNLLKTNIKRVGDHIHLIVTSDINKGRQFKRSYTLPKDCEVKKMNKYVTANGQYVVEFVYQDLLTTLAINLQPPKIYSSPEGKCVHLLVPIPDFCDPTKVQLQAKGRDLIVKFEERVIEHGDSASRVFYYKRVKLPENVNVNAISAKSDKHKLTILAPVEGVTTKGGISQQLHYIDIDRKLRHRKTQSVSSGVQGEEEQQVPVSGIEKQEQPQKPSIQRNKKQPVSMTKGKQDILGKKQPETPLPSSQLQENTDISEEKPLTSTISEKQPQKTNVADQPESDVLPSTTLPLEKKKKEKKSKQQQVQTPISGQPEKKYLPTGTSEKGSDILKKVFETGTDTSKQSPISQQSSSSTSQQIPTSQPWQTTSGSTEDKTRSEISDVQQTTADVQKTTGDVQKRSSDLSDVLGGIQSSSITEQHHQ